MFYWPDKSNPTRIEMEKNVVYNILTQLCSLQTHLFYCQKLFFNQTLIWIYERDSDINVMIQYFVLTTTFLVPGG